MANTPELTTTVTDAAGAAVIHIDSASESSATDNKLIISISNRTNNEITIDKLTGEASSSNYNVMFKLPNSKLYFYHAPDVDASTAPGNWSLATAPGTDGGWIDTIYLANAESSILNPMGQAGDTLTLVINYSDIVPNDPKSLNILVEVAYENFTDSSGTPVSGTAPTQSMVLMANAGRPSPLIGEFVGARTVLNDGSTQHQLTLRLLNTSLDPVQLLVPPSGEPTQSYIEVILPISDEQQDELWALCNTSAWDLIQVALSGSASAGWQVNKSATTAGSIKLEPDITMTTNIPTDGVIELQLSNVVSGLAPGIVQVQVALHRFAIIGTQAFGATLEKTPLVYNSSPGSGMTLAAGSLGLQSALVVSGDSDDILTHIVQSGAGYALQVDGGNVQLSSDITAAGNANISGSLTAGSANVSGNVTAGSANVSGNLAAGSANVNGNLTADSANVYGDVTANNAHAAGTLTAGSANVSGNLAAGSANVNGNLTAQTASLSSGMDADGYVLFCRTPDYSSGTVSIGSPTPSGNTMLRVVNNQSTGYAVIIEAPGLSSGNNWWALSVTGDCINSSGSWYRFSDINLKKQVEPFADGLNCILKIDPISFRYKDEAELGAGKHVGLSAQEVNKIAPYMMGKSRLKADSEKEYLAMDPGPLTYMLINAVKELHAEIETLKSKIDHLEKR